MALSSILYLGTEAPSTTDYNSFGNAVNSGLGSGEIESGQSFGLVGYKKSNPNVVAFSVSMGDHTSVAINMNSDNTKINADTYNGTNLSGYTAYYSVDLGVDSVVKGWTLTLNTTNRDKKTGTWVFVKSSTEPPHM